MVWVDMVIMKQMLVLFMMMLIGLIACKKQIITSNTNKALSGIVVNISNPALMLSSVVGNYELAEAKDLILAVIVAISMFVILMVLAWLVPKLLKAGQNQAGIYSVMTVFSNIGFMGFPIISSLYGREALLYASIFLLPYNLLIYTYGIQRLNQTKENEKINLKQILNIGVLASILTIVLYLFKVHINGWIGDSLVMLSDLTAPLSMMIIGASFAEIDIRDLIKDKRLVLFSLMKQFIIPLIVGWFMLIYIQNSLIAGITVIMLATPVGSMCAMIARTYERDCEIVSKGIVLTTVASLISIPLVTMILL